ncbi:MAG: AAA family ATPase, partial [Solirubrobacteraceae bacterium]|nr:AAA family ATPase [Solirubrobacteraceae bacterium]
MSTAWRSRLVGRELPLAALESALTRSTGGELQTVVLGGEPGIGKTRLCSELAQRAHAAGALVLFGRCDEEPLLPHQPFIEGLRQYIAGADPVALGAQLGPGGGELLRILPELAARVPSLPVPVQGDPEGARFRLFEAVGSLLANVCRQRPVVLVLDDLHWADKPTLLLLRYLTRALPTSRLLVLGTYRETEVDAGHPFAATLAELRTTAGFTPIGLGRLDEADVDRLVADHRAAGGADASTDDGVGAEHSGHRIYEETDGNPFFVVEMLSHLEETGGAGLGLGVPEGVKDVIARRLARLDTDANRALAIASIVGRDFQLGVLDGMSDLGEDRLADVLETAAQAHVIEEVAGTVGQFTFSHALTRETVYGMLTNTRRALLHRRAAVVIEARHAADLGPHRAELAHHFECAGTPEDFVRATEHRAAAGDRDLALLAYEQAARHFRRAAALIRQLGMEGGEGQRCDLVIAQGEAERQSGDAAYRETLLEGARLAGEIDDAGRLARAVLANNRELFSSAQGVDQERVAAIRAALAAQPDVDSAVRAELLALLAVEQLAGPDWEGRRALADDAVAMARRVGDRRTLGAVVQRRYVALWGPQTVAQRRADAEETGAIGIELGDPMLTFAGAALGSIVAMEAGDPARADELLDRVAPLVRQLGQPVLRWYEVVCHAKRTTMNGHPLDAERLAREAFEVGQEAGQPDVVAWFFLQTVAARLAGGRLGADDPDLPLLFSMPGLSLPVSPEYTPSASVGLQMESTKALTFSEIGRFDEARHHLGVAMANGLRDLSHDFAALSIPAFAAVAACHLGDRAKAEVLHRVIEPHRAQFVDSGAMWLGAAPHYLARLEVLLGRPEDADASFAAAAERYAELGADAWLARLRIDWAGALAARGDGG